MGRRDPQAEKSLWRHRWVSVQRARGGKRGGQRNRQQARREGPELGVGNKKNWTHSKSLKGNEQDLTTDRIE